MENNEDQNNSNRNDGSSIFLRLEFDGKKAEAEFPPNLFNNGANNNPPPINQGRPWYYYNDQPQEGGGNYCRYGAPPPPPPVNRRPSCTDRLDPEDSRVARKERIFWMWIKGGAAVLGIILLAIIIWTIIFCESCWNEGNMSHPSTEVVVEVPEPQEEMEHETHPSPQVIIPDPITDPVDNNYADCVKSENILFKCWEEVNYFSTHYAGLIPFEDPPEFTKEILIAAEAATRSEGNEYYASQSTTMPDLHVGFIGVTQDMVNEFNFSENGSGLNKTMDNFIGEGLPVKNSIWLFSTMVQRNLSKNQQSNIHGVVNFQPGRSYDATPTEHSECVLRNMEVLRDALKRRGYPYQSTSKIAATRSNALASITNHGFVYPLQVKYEHSDHVNLDKRLGRIHHGHDLSGIPRGTEIHAIRGGRVFARGYQVKKSGPKKGKGWGRYLHIEDGTYVWVYAHMQDRFVNVGDVIVQNHVIGTVGDTGSKGAIHLHVECWKISEWNKKGKGGKPENLKQLWP